MITKRQQQYAPWLQDAMKALYWTVLIYDYKEAERTTLTLEEAKDLYSLVDHELLWEPKQDTKCLMAFGPNTIVVVFRGTASLKNASADLQVSNTWVHAAAS